MIRSLAYALLMLGAMFVHAAPIQDDGAPDPGDVKMIKAIFDHVLVQGESYQMLDHLCNKIGPRLSGSEGAARAVEWAQQVMHDAGFDRVTLQEVMVPHWERGGKEVATILGDGGEDPLTVLAIGGSVGTDPDGLTAEVVEVQSLDEVAELGEDRIGGKIVFYNRAFDQRNINTGASYGGAVDQRVGGPSQAAKYGAVGVVIRSVSSSFDDAPHTGTLRYKEGVPRIPAAALGVQSALRLTAALEKNPSLKLYLNMSCRWLPDVKSYNVVGELSGSDHPDEIILVGGHLDSWDVAQGAHDDGAGSVQSIGVLRTLQALNYKPKHTIRAVLFMNEENGTRGGQKYAKLAGENKEKHIIAIETDSGGFVPRGFSVTAPESTLAKMRSWLPYFDKNTISYISKGGGGADIRPLNAMYGVPTVGLRTDSQRYFDIHHSRRDVFSAVDRRELELGTGSLTALIYLIDRNGL